jgi:hypothetical protein
VSYPPDVRQTPDVSHYVVRRPVFWFV